MRIAHRNSGNIVCSSVYIQRFVDDLFGSGNYRDLSGSKNGRSHVYFYQGNLTVFAKSQIQVFNATFGGNRNAGFVDDTVVINIFGNAADTVSAHGSLGTVQVVHIHLAVSDVGWFDQDQSVRTDAEVTVTDESGYSSRISDSFFEAVYIYIIVSDTMHLGEFHKFPP